jgi:hypothetical protein
MNMTGADSNTIPREGGSYFVKIKGVSLYINISTANTTMKPVFMSTDFSTVIHALPVMYKFDVDQHIADIDLSKA